MNPIHPEILAAGRRKEWADTFQKNRPFPHIVMNDFLEQGAAEAVLKEFYAASGEWIKYYHFNQKKFGFNLLDRMGPTTQEVIRALGSKEFISFLEDLSGIRGLILDLSMDGGGLQEMRPDGHLNMHIDSMAHVHRRNWKRQLNLLVYLNKDWKEEYGGNLELWDSPMSRRETEVQPLFNRCVIFHTTPTSFHGIPGRIRCPEGMSRKSLILYYYTQEKDPMGIAPTTYYPQPRDSAAKRLAIALDQMLINVYTFLRGSLGISQSGFHKVLKYFLR